MIKIFDSLYDQADRLNSSSKKRGMKDEIDRVNIEKIRKKNSISEAENIFK